MRAGAPPRLSLGKGTRLLRLGRRRERIVVSRTSGAPTSWTDPDRPDRKGVGANAEAEAENAISIEEPEIGASGSLSERSDQDLLEGIRAASEPHFAELYKRYFQRIYNFVYMRMRNHAETEEVVQETFLAVFRSFQNYRGQSSLLSWIYGIAKNTANNAIRRARSQSERIDLADEEDLLPRSSIGLASPAEQLDMQRFQDQLSARTAPTMRFVRVSIG